MDNRRVSRFLSPAGFTLSLVVPSTVILDKYLGLAGVIAYGVTSSIVLPFVHRHFFDRLVPAITRKEAIGLGAGIVVLLVVMFSVGYPFANSGVIGPGSDRDEHLQIGTTELLHGRYPYYRRGPYDGFISQMPGAFILAVPFVLLGNGAYQNLFWLIAFVAALSRAFSDVRPALLLMIVIFSMSPIVLNEYVIGGDLLSNSIYVLLFTVWLVRVVPRPDATRWHKLAAAAALGIGLSSRGQFLLLVPLVFSALAQRAGIRTAAQYTAMVCAAFGLVTIPFYWYDPAGFTPLETVGFLHADFLPSNFSVVLAGMCAAVAMCCAMDRRNGDLSVLLKYGTLVLAVPVLAAVLNMSVDRATLDFFQAGYGLSFVFFGAVAFIPCEDSGLHGSFLSPSADCPARRPRS